MLFWEGKDPTIPMFNIAMVLLCPLSHTLVHLNHLNGCQKSRYDNYDDLSGHPDALNINFLHSPITTWKTSEIVRYEKYILAVTRIPRESRSSGNEKLSLSCCIGSMTSWKTTAFLMFA